MKNNRPKKKKKKKKNKNKENKVPCFKGSEREIVACGLQRIQRPGFSRARVYPRGLFRLQILEKVPRRLLIQLLAPHFGQRAHLHQQLMHFI